MNSKNFAGQKLDGRSFRGQDLRGADFSGCSLKSCDFRDADLSQVDFRSAIFGISRRRRAAKILVGILIGLTLGFLSIVTNLMQLMVSVYFRANVLDRDQYVIWFAISYAFGWFSLYSSRWLIKILMFCLFIWLLVLS